MKTEHPLISVIMAVYNGEDTLDETLSSILNQTFKNFELLVMDDGSTDRTREILQQFAASDSRIKIFHQPNAGNCKSRNALVRNAQSGLIANMDADDIAYPQRLEVQYKYMQEHPQTVLVSTYAKIVKMDGRGRWRQSTAFEEDELNRWYLSIIPPFIHSSVMFQKDAFEKAGGYREDEYPAEDYGLWVRMKRHGKLNTAPQILTEYRLRPKGISAQNFRRQIARRDELNFINLEDLYAAGEIPTVGHAMTLLKPYRLDKHQRQILGKLACLTGCFLVQKKERQKAAEYFKLCLKMDWRRFDAALNLLLRLFNRAFLISLDKYPLRFRFLFKIYWFPRSHSRP